MFQKYKQKIIAALAVPVITLSFFLGFSLAFAQEETAIPQTPAPAATTAEPNQRLQLTDITRDTTKIWQADPLLTSGLKFVIRSREALAWSLDIENTGIHTGAIESSYIKVLTVVNSLFILGLLIIAGMWMFSILIPRARLKRVILIFSLAAIFINFALPLNQILIDTTNLLQKTLLTHQDKKIAIVDIVETPLYQDLGTVGYEESSHLIQSSASKQITFQSSGPDTPIQIGEVSPSPETPDKIEGILSGDAGGVIALDLKAAPRPILLSANQPLSAEITESFNPNKENALFAFGLMVLTGIAYFILALLFIFRIVILWALLIASPILFLLSVFNFTRSYFYNWIGIYVRWMLIGPLAALGISIIVNIWQSVGIPLSSAYVSSNAFGAISNLAFYLPGSATPNTLSTPKEMMEYIVFLMMLYIPIFFAFILTRQKGVTAAVEAVLTRSSSKQSAPIIIQGGKSETKSETKSKETIRERGGVVETFKTLFLRPSAPSLETAVPERIRETGASPAPQELKALSASSFLPEHLALSSIPEMINLVAPEIGSRHRNEVAITKLAAPENITDLTERKHISTIRTEIEKRASQGDLGALKIQTEINLKKEEKTPQEHQEHIELPKPEKNMDLNSNPKL